MMIDEQREFLCALNNLTDKELLVIGKRIAPTDYGVRFYNNKQHKKFFHNRETLLKAIRRGYSFLDGRRKEELHRHLEV